MFSHGAGGDREEISPSGPSSGTSGLSSFFLLADNIPGKEKGQSGGQGPGERLSQVGPTLPLLEEGWYSERNLPRVWWLWSWPRQDLAWEALGGWSCLDFFHHSSLLLVYRSDVQHRSPQCPLSPAGATQKWQGLSSQR